MSMSPAVIGSMIAQLAGTFEAMVPELSMIPNIPPQTLTNVTTAIDDLKQTAMAFSAADAPGDLLSRIEADAEAVLGVLATLPLPPPLAMAFRVAQFVLPVLLAAAQMVVKAPTA
ncbi:MAG TPA: hypothetical protein VGM38_09395 [Pseudolysinimonas sp.]|jgi:hypothetical protein